MCYCVFGVTSKKGQQGRAASGVLLLEMGNKKKCQPHKMSVVIRLSAGSQDTAPSPWEVCLFFLCQNCRPCTQVDYGVTVEKETDR